jgi:hypothetical protein
MHHENTARHRIGDHHFSVFLLLDHDSYEHYVCAGFSRAKILNPVKRRYSYNDREPFAAQRFALYACLQSQSTPFDRDTERSDRSRLGAARCGPSRE